METSRKVKMELDVEFRRYWDDCRMVDVYIEGEYLTYVVENGPPAANAAEELAYDELKLWESEDTANIEKRLREALKDTAATEMVVGKVVEFIRGMSD